MSQLISDLSESAPACMRRSEHVARRMGGIELDKQLRTVASVLRAVDGGSRRSALVREGYPDGYGCALRGRWRHAFVAFHFDCVKVFPEKRSKIHRQCRVTVTRRAEDEAMVPERQLEPDPESDPAPGQSVRSDPGDVRLASGAHAVSSAQRGATRGGPSPGGVFGEDGEEMIDVEGDGYLDGLEDVEYDELDGLDEYLDEFDEVDDDPGE